MVRVVPSLVSNITGTELQLGLLLMLARSCNPFAYGNIMSKMTTLGRFMVSIMVCASIPSIAWKMVYPWRVKRNLSILAQSSESSISKIDGCSSLPVSSIFDRAYPLTKGGVYCNKYTMTFHNYI